jgi:hypothetical protein
VYHWSITGPVTAPISLSSAAAEELDREFASRRTAANLPVDSGSVTYCLAGVLPLGFPEWQNSQPIQVYPRLSTADW